MANADESNGDSGNDPVPRASSGRDAGGGPIAVLGAGSWGTALAIQLARADAHGGERGVRLWGRDADAVAAMQVERCNVRYLPSAPFPDGLAAEPELESALDGTSTVLVVVPSHAFRDTLARLAPHARRVGEGFGLAWATKGLELASGELPHRVAAGTLPGVRRLAVLSGPTFATEVGAGLPTAMTVAANEAAFADELAARLSGESFRVYTSTDMIGVEVGGAVKNALAIAAGLSDGLGYGANARVALINRGLREMTRFGMALGAEESTFAGLAAMGDLVLTCTDDQSRNRRMGLALASGRGLEGAIADIGQVVEGVKAARAVHEQALRLGVDMPIVAQVYRILHEGVAPREAVRALMSRRSGAESG